MPMSECGGGCSPEAVAAHLTRDDVDADGLTALMAGEELTTLTTALTALHPELGDR
jgi:simple sugar transport system ATP-binding protein